jgi:cytosine permease
MKNKVEKNHGNQDDSYEYAFESVPEDKRRSLSRLTLVLAGYPIALSNFVIGGSVGVNMSFSDALVAIFAGNAILIAVVIAMGILAFRTGLSTTFLSKRAFGKSGSHIFAVLLALSAITWTSVNGDIFSRMIKATFGWWPLPVSITAVLVIFMWLYSALKGFKGLETISKFGVPAALVLTIYSVYKVWSTSNGFESVFSYVPTSTISFTAASAAVVGGWIYGATITPDVCRFAKRKLHVVIAGSVAFSIGCLGFQIAGMLVAISTGIGDFTAAMGALGLLFLAFLAAFFCLWTTQDKDIYAGSLALQNIINDTKYSGKIKHKHNALVIASIAAIFAALGIYSYIMPIIQFLAILIPPVPGIVIAQELIVKRSKEDRQVSVTSIIAWIVGGAVSYISLQTGLFIPPLVGIISAGLSYILLEKLMYKNVSIISTKIDENGIQQQN